MPVMSRREGDTDSGGHNGQAGPAVEEDPGPERVPSQPGHGSVGSPAATAGDPGAENNNNGGVSCPEVVDSKGGMTGPTEGDGTAPGGETGGQVDRHGNGDADGSDQGVNTTRTGEEAGRGVQEEEAGHVEGEDGTALPPAAAPADAPATAPADAAGTGDTKEQEAAADGDSDRGNHGNVVERDQPHHGADNPGSVINVEIRPKSTTGKQTSGQHTGRDTPPPGVTNHTSGVAPDIPPAHLTNSFPEPMNTANKTTESNDTNVSQNSSKPPRRKKMKKSIFFSYSPDAGFVERKFVVECVRQFKEINLAEDIWFDKDEKSVDSPCWFSQRLEAAERCRAAVVFLSESYFSCPVAVHEAKTLLDRHRQDPNSVRIFPVLFSNGEDVDIPRPFLKLASNCVNLTGTGHLKKSLAERASVVVGSLIIELEKIASINAPPVPFTPPDTEFTGEYKKKKLCHWGANDLQEWLFKLGVKEFYRQSLAENMVDGFLLMATTDQDMVTYLAIDSRIVRKKITQQVLATLEKENKQPEAWHVRAKGQRSRPNSIYLIYDPADVRLAQNLKHDLTKKNLQVSSTRTILVSIACSI